MRYVVCLKVTPKVEQIRFDEVKKAVAREGVENEINEADKNALEAALFLKDKHGGSVTVMTMGPPSFDPFLKLAVAMGADEAILLSDRSFAMADTYATSRVLAAALKKLQEYNLVICGEASSDGSTEQVPASIAEWLGIPRVTYAIDVEVKDSKLISKRSVQGGYEVVETELPALVSVELGCNSPRFPDFRRKRWAEKEYKSTVWGMTDLGFSPDEVGLQGSLTSVEELRKMASPARKAEAVTGTPREVAAKLVQIINASGR
ncbi:MAG: electron transfer flavoprotein subunit beta/FixA family protein [Nitrososphaerales archaeon]|jgi:electron transfer flavoprotein beta subunit